MNSATIPRTIRPHRSDNVVVAVDPIQPAVTVNAEFGPWQSGATM